MWYAPEELLCYTENMLHIASSKKQTNDTSGQTKKKNHGDIIKPQNGAMIRGSELGGRNL